VDGFDAIEGEFRNRLRGLSAGELNIAAGSSTILYLLPPLVQAFREAHPDIQLKLHNVTGKDGLAMIRSDEVDLAVGSMLDVPNDLDYAPVQSFDPMLIAPPDHPLATSDAAHAGGPLALRPDPAAQAPDHVPPRRPRVPAAPRALHRGAGSRRLGNHQAVRGDGPGHLDRHRHLHRRQPTASASRSATCASISRRAATAW
jgi:DNA-binding transcriptional LysR family regulator